MIHSNDLSLAFVKRNIADIQDAFRALVGYPKEEAFEGACPTALQQCCEALAEDESLMPAGTVDAINDRSQAENGNALPFGARYKVGSARVLACFGLFAAELPADPRD